MESMRLSKPNALALGSEGLPGRDGEHCYYEHARGFKLALVL